MQLPEDNAIVVGAEDTVTAKIAVFKECGIEVAVTPCDMADVSHRLLRRIAICTLTFT